MTVDGGLGALLAWLAVGGWLVGSAVLIADGYRAKNAEKRNGLRALARCHERNGAGQWNR